MAKRLKLLIAGVVSAGRSVSIPLAMFFVAYLGVVEAGGQTTYRDDTVRVPFIRIRQSGPGGLNVHLSPGTATTGRLSLTSDVGPLPTGNIAIRFVRGDKLALLDRAKAVRGAANVDTCFFILGTRTYPVDIGNNQVNLAGYINDSWLDIDGTGMLIPTRWVIVLEEGPDVAGDLQGLRIRPGDLERYLKRAADIIFTPEPGEAPSSVRPTGRFLTSAEIKAIRCVRYKGPATANIPLDDSPSNYYGSSFANANAMRVDEMSTSDWYDGVSAHVETVDCS